MIGRIALVSMLSALAACAGFGTSPAGRSETRRAPCASDRWTRATTRSQPRTAAQQREMSQEIAEAVQTLDGAAR
jgi:hypothetical protein